ncbi:ferritin-like domain-containing protein [Hyphococcus flavus]|uniref:Ferritin-like domain-containing protein n=1 Tax=Hyphococcus flavus TaxID=1866326 RepID=A0AAE9ZFK6_9PROT|nr:ferritin-like domain-containing protein [Hyphococcus flavus]WDI31998.1 ferritin-like domain-containing protein [Hyphococcus flavus]
MKSVELTILNAAYAVLTASDPAEKCAAAVRADRLLASGAPLGQAVASLPDKPARPDQPVLVPPGEVPKRRLGSEAGRTALLHAIAHIEFNAIDLAFDMAARFTPEIEKMGLDSDAFARDWVRIGSEEARHFSMINQRLNQLGSEYGAFPAHNGLWEAASNTQQNALARLAIAPLILEARGLDVTPDMIERLRSAGDEESVSILEVIYREEVGHVACGKRWFDAICAYQQREPLEAFHAMRDQYFAGQLKPPFNHKARQNAGMSRAFYEPNGNEKRV